MSTHANRVKMTVTSVASAGVGTITLNAASSGYRTFATAYGANATVDILITEGTAWEIARNCTYTHSGTTVTRGTLESSSTGSAVTFTSAATVSVIASAAFGNAAENLMGVFGENVVSVTGAVTATLGSMHHCTGTSADYTVTLPAASGNTGKLIGFRMGSASGLTKRVTIDGNASETIDGATTRIMWSNETAVLYCDGSNWFKVAGKTIPVCAQLARGSAQTFASATYTKVTLDTELIDVGSVADPTTNNRFDLFRAGNYLISAFARIDMGGATAYEVVVGVFVNGSEVFRSANSSATAVNVPCSGCLPIAAGDYVSLHIYQADVVSRNTLATVGLRPIITVSEVPQW